MKRTAALALALLSTAHAVTLTGAGASFPYPLYSRYFYEYAKREGVQVNYQPLGSGLGQTQFLRRTVDFGASDTPLSAADAARAPGRVLQVPAALGAIVVAYNLPGVTERVKLSADVLADMYLGRIRTWRDPRITGLNDGVTFPNLPVSVVHRSDASGSTQLFSTYLAHASADWQRAAGIATRLNWPGGTPARGNDGLARIVNDTPGAIGYMELVYAARLKLPYAQLRNRAGAFVSATPATIDEAARTATNPGSVVDAPRGYPLTSYSYLLAYADQGYGARTEAQARALKGLLKWILTDAQRLRVNGYQPLPEGALRDALSAVAGMTYKGKPLP
ncbi:phosphate ABC transporter substrate-binding protein PstS [Deinococcus maricopensis]|uniref:Phosphate-binding protein n=1 Tax=Deinococcus maricopensis (strain DSM 21211 / LMG 22137 / NRRL B-23946 / LB-34) TaxID=709986 RepID=E8U7I1_DEIML|nr:phosphate ABC transporter substrate-binding protein PstS [Deinococcus maricopensis]ADV67020.1 phosphate ABC transporter, periplasmic phosphate-binding protein [Deinococcus maricopensis DSM 21211]